METVYKYKLKCSGEQWIEMPITAKVLTVQMQNGEPCLWAKVRPDEPQALRRFVTHGTGHQIPETTGKYIGTYQLNNGELIFHVFETT